MALSTSVIEAIEKDQALKAQLEKVAEKFGVSFETVAERLVSEGAARKAGTTTEKSLVPHGEPLAAEYSEAAAKKALPPAPGAPETQDTTAYTKYPGTDSLEKGQGFSVKDAASRYMDTTPPNKMTGKAALGIGGAAALGAGGIAAMSKEDQKPIPLPGKEGQSASLEALRRVYPGENFKESQQQYQDDLQTVGMSELPGMRPNEAARLRTQKDEAQARIKSVSTAKAPQFATTLKDAVLPKKEPEAPTEPVKTVPAAPKTTEMAKTVNKVAGVAVPTAPKPTELEKILSTFESKIEKSQTSVKSAMNTQLSELKDLETTYRNEAKASKDEIAKRELAENMGHALAQLGAGIQGMNTGVDMSSGLKFSKTDWNKRYEAALDELKANLTDLREKRGEVKAMGLEGMKEAERLGERGMGFAAGELARKESAASAAGLESRREAFQGKEKEADRKSREAIAGIRASAAQSAAAQKLNEKQSAAVDEATNSLLEDYETIQTAEDKEAKKLAIKNYEKHKQVLNTYLGDSGKTVGAIEAKLKDVPFLSTTSSYLEEQLPEQAGVLQKAVAGRAPTKAAVPGVAAGQAPAAGGTIQVRDSVQGSPTFGQTKAVKNSEKVQQLIREGKLQAVR